MKRSVVLAVAVMLMGVVLASSVSAGPVIDRILSKKELVLGTSGTYPPLTFRAKDGTIKGLDVDLGKAVATVMGVKLRVVRLPFDQLIPALEKGRIDMIISCMTITPQRNLRVAFVGPYFVSGQSVLTSREKAASITSPADINRPDFVVAVPRGTTSEMIVTRMLPKAKAVVAGSADEALDMVLKGSVTGMLADYPTCAVAALRYKDKGLGITAPFGYEPLGIAVRSKDPLMVNMLQNFLGLIRKGGELDIMTKRWFADTSWINEMAEEK